MNLAALVFGTFVLLIRQGGHPAWDTIWAEDGRIFLPNALFHPVSSLFHSAPVRGCGPCRSPWHGGAELGYLQLPQQLIADATAKLPLADAATGLAVAGALVASGCALFVFHASSGHVRKPWLRALLAASVILLPTAVIEIANTDVNTSWYLLFTTFWLLLWRPRARAGMTVAFIIGFAAMTAQGLAVLYAPLVAMRVIALPRLREHAAAAGWFTGLALQVGVSLGSGLPPVEGSLPDALNYYFHHVLVAAVTGWHLAQWWHTESGSGPLVVIAGCAVAAMAGWAIIRGGTRLRLFAVTALVLGILLTVVPAMSRPWVTTSPVTNEWLPGSRYTAAPILLITSLAIVIADTWLLSGGDRCWNIIHQLAAAAIIAVLAVTWTADFRYVNLRTAGPDWPQAVSRFRDSCQQQAPSVMEPLFYWANPPNKLPLPCWVARRQ
ncbi:MAG TPA: hypothetical protein VGS19_37090 [Streptosporangiaceae bacterium]|nr:hypothetical protein [Streptosporangiaceae bacterium]